MAWSCLIVPCAPECQADRFLLMEMEIWLRLELLLNVLRLGRRFWALRFLSRPSQKQLKPKCDPVTSVPWVHPLHCRQTRKDSADRATRIRLSASSVHGAAYG